MLLQEPKVEFVEIDMIETTTTNGSVKCIEDGHSGQGGTSCIGNAEHSTGSGCDDTAPMIE